MYQCIYTKEQSKTWNDGLPTGSGRLAAMLWENGEDLILSTNNENLWSGDYKDRKIEEGADLLPRVRAYLLKGENFKATALAAIAFGGNGGISPLLRRMDTYQPASDLVLTGLGPFVSRTLNLETGVVSEIRKGVHITQFCHAEDECIMLHLEGMSINTTLSVTRLPQQGFSLHTNYEKDSITVTGDAGKGVSWQSDIALASDGIQIPDRDGITITNATFITAKINIISEAEILRPCDMPTKDFKDTLKRHEMAFSSLMARSSIEIEGKDSNALSHLPIEERCARLRDGKSDPDLIALYARYGQYLLVSSSIHAKLPMHLQGKWDHETFPKWNSDYHLNINLQMNYWASDALGYAEYTEVMLAYLTSLIPNGKEAARKLYGCGGIMLALNSDYWRNITAEAYNYAVWIGAAGWFATHFFDHYLYTGSLEWLRDKAWPFIKEAARFYVDYIEFDGNGKALIMPSQSPENRYKGCGYFPVSNCINSAMDIEICHDALTVAIKSAKILSIEDGEVRTWQDILTRLPSVPIAKDGRLVEWDSEDKVELEPGHRHFSHLYGVYPSSQFTPERDTPRFEAAKKSLAYRLAHGSGHTGWSLAWGSCLFARFQDKAGIEKNLSLLISTLSSGSLLDLHPDYYPQHERPTEGKDDPFLFNGEKCLDEYVFQIDGNMGATAAVIEALVQLRDGVIHLLPAVPDVWQRGSVSHLRIKDGNTLSFTFENGTITALEIILGYRENAICMYNGKKKTIKGAKGEKIILA